MFWMDDKRRAILLGKNQLVVVATSAIVDHMFVSCIQRLLKPNLWYGIYIALSPTSIRSVNLDCMFFNYYIFIYF